jgi:hypothetical protein
MTRDDRVNCFTSATFSYLDRARILSETLRVHHPDWVLWLCLPDEPPSDCPVSVEAEPFDHVLRLHDLDIPNQRAWIFSRDIVELSTAVKGPVLNYLLNNTGARRVVYLDPDIAIFGSLDSALQLLEQHPIVPTPHLLDPEQTVEAIADNEIGCLKHGVFNLGFLMVRDCPEGLRFARWWRDRLMLFCYDDIPAGLFTDQRWCDLVPVLFPTAAILRDPGYNVASWNLGHRRLCFTPEGAALAGGSQLRFYHFTKVQTVGEGMIERYSKGSTGALELLRWYRERLKANAVVGVASDWWHYGRYADGTPISRSQRLRYRTSPEIQRLFPDPFAVGPTSYLNWCIQNGI